MATAPPGVSRRLSLLGGLVVEPAGGVQRGLGPKQRSLLAALALHHRAPLTRERLVDTLWPDASLERASHLLSDSLYRLQRALGPGWIIARPQHGEPRLEPGVWVDVWEFERLSAAGDPVSLEQAVALYAGDLLPELYDDWVLAFRVLLHETYFNNLLRLGQLGEDRQQPAAALSHYQRLSLADPLREDARRGQMRSLARLGRLAEALEAYRKLTALLDAELGAAPQPDTQALAATLRREWELASEAGPANVPGLAAPFVGRAAERGRLLARLDQVRLGAGGLVVVLGEAGIGKTRLLGELVQAADWRGWQIARAAGEAAMPRPAYAPLNRALAEALPLPRLQQLAQLLAPAWLEMAAVLAGLRGGSGAQAEADRSDLTEPRYLPAALRHVLAGLSQIAPHLLILDDVQWADPALWPLLEGVREALNEMDVLIVLAGRGGELQAQPEVWANLEAWNREGVPILRLQGLNRTELRELARGQGQPQLDQEQLDRLEAASGGSPLLALALLQTDDPHGLTQQPSLADLMQRRLDRLTPEALAALQAAAVAGYRFDYDLWQAVSGLPPGAGAPSLPRLAGELEQARLIVLEHEGYRFAHDTLRDYVYAGIDTDARAAYHGRAFRAVDSRYMHPMPDDPTPAAATLLHHAQQAGVRPAVARAARLAGQEALGRFAFAAAVDFFTLALDTAADADLETRYAIVLGRVRAREALSVREPQRPDLDHLAELADRLGDPSRRAQSDYRQAMFEWQAGAYRPAAEAAERGLTLAREGGDAILEARLLAVLGRVARDAGRYADAHAFLGAALELQRAQGEQSELAGTLSVLSSVCERQGAPRQALAYSREALAIHQAAGDLFREGHCAGNIGVALWQAGEYGEARAMIEHSLAIGRETGDLRAQSAGLSNLGSLAAIRGDLAGAAALFGQALDLRQHSQNRHGASAIMGNLAELRFDLGQYEEALARFDDALALNRDIGRRRGEAYSHAGRGCVLLELGRPAEARAALEAAAEIRVQLGERGNLAHTRANLAVACLTLGDEAAAQAYLEPALAGLEAQDDSPAMQRDVRFAAFQVLAGLGRPAEANQQLQQAHAAMQAMAESLPPDARPGFMALPINQRVQKAAALQARRLPVRLARAAAPLGRRLTDADYLHMEWTVWAPTDEQLPAGVERRRGALRRLLAEAAAAGAAPTDDDLAQALGVSRRSILRDMAVLAAAGHPLPTRRRA